MRPLMRRAALLVVLWVAPAAAHDADVIYVSIDASSAQAPLREEVTLTPQSLALLAPVDANADQQLTQADLDQSGAALRAGVWEQMPLSAGTVCVRSAERATLRDGYVELTARFSCADGELSQTFRWLSILPPGYRVVLGSQIGGEQGRAFAQGSTQTLHLPRPGAVVALERPGALESLRRGALRPLVDLQALALLLALLLAAPSVRRAALLPLVIAAGQVLGSALPATPLGPALAALAVATAAVAVLLGWRSWGAWPVAGLFGVGSGLPLGQGSAVTLAMAAVGLLASLWVLSAVALLMARLLGRRPLGRRAGAALVLGLSGFWLVERLLK